MTENNQTDASNRPGTVYLVGAGPGDPGLITVRGLEIIRTADAIVYDYLASPDLLQEARPDAQLVYVGKKGSQHELEQGEINELLVRTARQGKNVARLKGGDPYVFGRGGEEAEELVSAGIPFEVVPGVTSAVAAPAYAGIPVTHRDHASTVTFITGHEAANREGSSRNWDVLARTSGTLVFLMGVKSLPEISSALISHGKAPSTPAALIQWGTTPDQATVVSTLEGIPDAARQQGMKPPAVLVVGSVVSLREKLGWFQRKPLFGKRILITRSRAQSRRMADQVAAAGGRPVLFPTIAIEPPADLGPLDSCIDRIRTYDWAIFTSVNGVERFFARYFALGHDIRDMAGPRLGAIGPVTAGALQKLGLNVDLLAKEFRAEGILAELPADRVKGKRFLIPRAEKAREVLPQQIASMGGTVEVVPVYRTVPPPHALIDEVQDMLTKNRLHAVTFTSSSTVTHFVEMLGIRDASRLADDVVIASIGPITSRTLREHGFPVHVEAAEYTVDGLVQAIVQYYRSGAG